VKQVVQVSGFSEDQSERLLWLLDTLHVMAEIDEPDLEFYLKGGTCVQHHFPVDAQRFSKDIDIGVLAGGRRQGAIDRESIERYAKKLEASLTETGFPKGTLRLPIQPMNGSVLEVARTFEPLYAKSYTPNRLFAIEAGTPYVLIDFFLNETSPSYRKEKLNLIPSRYLDRVVHFQVATKERLLTDKVVVLSGESEPYEAKQEVKDVLDLGMLANQVGGLHLDESKRMLDAWAASKLIDPSLRVVRASKHTVEKLREEVDDQRLATDINALLPRSRVFASVRNWRQHCDAVITFLDNFSALFRRS